MLSLVDIMDMCECTEDEIEAIAMHEHVPDAIASEMASYLINSDDGVPKIKKIIIEDIEHARALGNQEQVEKLNQVLIHFVATHPEYPGKLN